MTKPNDYRSALGELDLAGLIQILKRKSALIVSVVLVCGFLAGLVSQYVLSPVYEAETLIMVSVASETLQTQNAIVTRVNQNGTGIITIPILPMQTYLEHLQSQAVMNKVVENLGIPGVSNNSLAKMVDASLIKDSNLISLKVRNNDPAMAAKIANGIAEQYRSLMDELRFSSVVILSPADIPVQPVKPLKTLNVGMAVIFGLFLSVPLAIYKEYADATLVTGEDVSQILNQALLGIVPFANEQNTMQAANDLKMGAGKSALSDNLVRTMQNVWHTKVGYNPRAKKGKTGFDLTPIAFKSPKSAMSEAFRDIRTNLDFARGEEPFKTLLVSSALPFEGKSTVAANLAVVAAQAGYKVMLVDSDLRRPIQHEIFQMPNSRGLTDCIKEKADPEFIAHRTTQENLKVLTSGPLPSDPAEVINSKENRIILSELAADYDLVIIDSPPLLYVTDASIIASQVDASILVARAGMTGTDEAMQALAKLTKAKTRLLGMILNQVVTDRNLYYGNYY